MTGTLVLARRLIRNNLRVPIFFILSLSQPILYLVLFGQLFSRVSPLVTDRTDSYIEFLAPGMAMLAAMFGSIYSGVGTLADVDRGMFDRIVTAPVSRASIAVSYLLSTCFLVVLQAGIILIVSVLMGASAPGGLVGNLAVVLVAVIAGIGFGAISNALAFLTGQSDAIMPLLNFMTLPMMFLSTTMISASLMPGWIHVASLFNPLSWAVSVARGAYTGVWTSQTTLFLILMLAFSAIAFWLMLMAFNRFLNRR
jgi:ABC-2 type transport system permease protein